MKILRTTKVYYRQNKGILPQIWKAQVLSTIKVYYRQNWGILPQLWKEHASEYYKDILRTE